MIYSLVYVYVMCARARAGRLIRQAVTKEEKDQENSQATFLILFIQQVKYAGSVTLAEKGL